MKISRLTLILIVALGIILALFAPRLLQRKTAPPSSRTETAKPILAAAKGIIESEDEAILSSEIKGIITHIAAKEGSLVKKGQPVIRFDDEKIMAMVRVSEANLRAARERLRELEAGSRIEDVDAASNVVSRNRVMFERAKDDFDRQRRLYEKDATPLIDLERSEERMKVSQEELSEAENRLAKLKHGTRKEEIDRARAMMESAQSDVLSYLAILKDYTIIAPFDGLVVQRLKEPAETVDINTPILKVINPSKLRVRAELEESDITKVTLNAPVEVLAESFRDRVYLGKVTKVLPSVEKKSLKTFDPMASIDINTQEIHIKLDDYTDLKNGMAVTVKFGK